MGKNGSCWHCVVLVVALRLARRGADSLGGDGEVQHALVEVRTLADPELQGTVDPHHVLVPQVLRDVKKNTPSQLLVNVSVFVPFCFFTDQS